MIKPAATFANLDPHLVNTRLHHSPKPIAVPQKFFRIDIRAALLILMIVFSHSLLAQNLEIIQLHNRPASEVVNLVRPFVGDHGTVVANGSQLIVKTDPNNMEQIRDLIATLDKGLAQFRISVLQSNETSADRLNAQASVRGRISNNGASINARGNLYQSNSKTDGEVTQQVRTLEGKPARIQVGQAYPIPTYNVTPYGNPYDNGGIRYQQATTGFAVTPRMVGEQVVMDVEPWSDRLSRRGGGIIETQSGHSTIRTPLGQWVRFGGMDDQIDQQRSGILQNSWRTGKRTMNIYIKVDKL